VFARPPPVERLAGTAGDPDLEGVRYEVAVDVGVVELADGVERAEDLPGRRIEGSELSCCSAEGLVAGRVDVEAGWADDLGVKNETLLGDARRDAHVG